MFDPYRKWLGIPKKYRPPTYYQLLGLEAGEDDPEVIEEAAIRQSAHLRTYQAGEHGELCTRLLNEVSTARTTLLNPAKRKKYDAELAKKSAKNADAPSLPPEDDPSLAFADLDDTPSLAKPPSGSGSRRTLDRVKRIKTEREPSGLFADDKTKYIILGVGGGVALLLVVVVTIVVVIGSGSSEPDRQDNVFVQDPKQPIKDPPIVPKPAIKIPRKKEQIKQKDPRPVVQPNPNPNGPREEHVVRLNRPGPASSFCVLPGGREVIVAGFQLQKYDIATNRVVTTYEGGQRAASAHHSFLELSPDGKTLYSLQMGAPVIHKWDVESGRQLGSFVGHDRTIIGMALLPDGRHLISAGRTYWCMWDVATQKEVFRSPKDKMIMTIALSPDGKTLMVYRYKRPEVWDIPNKKIVKDFFSSSKLSCVAIAPDGSKVMGYKWVQNKEAVRLERADFRQGMIVETGSRVQSLGFSADGRYFVAGAEDGSLHLCPFDLRNPRCLYRFQAHNKPVFHVCFSDDGKRIYSCGGDGLFKVWHVPDDVVIAAKPKPQLPPIVKAKNPNKPQQPAQLPTPQLVFLGKDVNLSTTKYSFSIANWAEYTNERFMAGGLMPPTTPVLEIRGTKTIKKMAIDRIDNLKKFSILVRNDQPLPDRVLAIIGIPKTRSYKTSKYISLTTPK